MSETHNDEWLAEEDVLETTGISHFLFVRYRTAGFFTMHDRSFYGRGGGSDRYLYAHSTIEIVGWLRAHRKETRSDDDRFWGLGFAGLVDLTKWVCNRLTLQHRKGLRRHRAHPENLKRAAAEIAKTPRTRTDALRAPFRHLQEQRGRKSLVEWAVLIGLGEEPAISLYEDASSVMAAFERGTGSSDPPDRELDIERMSLPRLCKLVADALPAERQQALLDCVAFDGLVKMAQSIDWHRVGTDRQVNGGAGVGPIAPFERLSTVWRSFDARAAIFAGLIFIRQKPEYSGLLDERLEYYATELGSLKCRFPRGAAQPKSSA